MNRYRYCRVAICLCICLVIGLIGRLNPSLAGSGLKVRLVITDTYVTHKTYPLKKGKHRQLHVYVDNSFGKTTIRYKSANKKIAKVTKKGYIKAVKKGTVKIHVTVTCRSGKKIKTKKSWVKIKVTGSTTEETQTEVPVITDTYTPLPTVDTGYTPAPTAAPQITGVMNATLIVKGIRNESFPVTILDTECGRALYNSLPKEIVFSDRDRNTKIAVETNPNMGYTRNDEYAPGMLSTGDFMLYGVDRYELAYADHTTGFSYTRLGRVLDTTGLANALGNGQVSVTLIKASPVTATPMATAGSGGGVTPPVSVTPTPAVTVAPTLAPGMTYPPGTTTKPVTSYAPGVTPTPVSGATSTPGNTQPTPYSGATFRLRINGNDVVFMVDQSSSVASELYQELGSGYQTHEMTKHGSENRYYHTLENKTYTETSQQAVDKWPAGSLVLVGNNELTIVLSTITLDGSRPSWILGRLDPSVIPAGGSAQQYLSTFFNGQQTVTTLFYKG